MKASQADELSQRLITCLETADLRQASSLLVPVLQSRTPFRVLDRIGARIGTKPLAMIDPFLDELAQSQTEGAWVIIGSALAGHIPIDLNAVLQRSRIHIIAADTWYAAGILGERVPGTALVTCFANSLRRLKPWRQDPNRWVRRALGHAVHVWAKRTQGSPSTYNEAETLLAFFEPLFGEQNIDALKGIGWGLKTMGKTYPNQVAEWLHKMVVEHKRPHKALLLQKACTYLPEHARLIENRST